MKTFKIKNRVAEYDVSKIIFGTTYLGNYNNKPEAFSHLQEYYDLGGRCIDSARVYSNLTPDDIYPSESVIGEWLEKTGLRKDIIISTKGAHPPYDDMNCSRLSSRDINYDLNESLKALKTDYIDIYWLHRDDEKVAVEDIIITLNRLIDMGKIKIIGASNWSAKRIAQANNFARENNLIGFSAGQIQWSLAKTSQKELNDDTLICMDKDEYNFYKDNNLSLMAYNSQSKGLFSKLFEYDGDITKLPQKVKDRFLSESNREENLKAFEKVKLLANKYKVSPAVICLSFITNNNLNAGAVIGCSNITQIRDSMCAQDFILLKEEVEYLNNI